MDWIRGNWFWVVVGIAFVWMHLKMHAGHGMHGHSAGHGAHGGHGAGGCGGIAPHQVPTADSVAREEDAHASH